MKQRCSRRAALRSIAAGSVLVGGMFAGTTSAASAGGGWFRQYGYDGANTGSTAAESVTRYPDRSWLHQLDGLDAPPLVVGDVVIAYSIDIRETRLVAYDRATGEREWSFSTATPAVTGTVAADDDHVYIGGIIDPTVIAVSLADGDIVWETTLEFVSSGFNKPPRHDGDWLYFLTRSGSIERFDPGSGDTQPVAAGEYTRFAVSDGAVFGVRGKPDAAQTGVDIIEPGRDDIDQFETAGRPGRPVVGDDTLYIGTSTAEVLAVDRGTLTEDWRVSVPDWAVTLTEADGTLIVHNDDILTAFDASDGTEQWQIEAGASRATVAGETVYVGREGGFDAYRLSTGSRRFSYTADDLRGKTTYLVPLEDELFTGSLWGDVARYEELELFGF